nr:L-carnitine dehydratase/bile acid-inducible protein [Aeromicrobium sp.]
MFTAQAHPGARPLEGLRIVEVSSFVAAPLGGMTLAQLGADVVRVDPLGGAPDTSRWPLTVNAASLYWAGLNKGKRSFEVDFRSQAGRDLVRSLVVGAGETGGILLTNAVGRDWLSYESLARLRPDLVHLQIEGKHDGSPAVDYTVNAAVGFPLVTGPEGLADPVNHVLPAWDIACGLYASIAILAAERHRRTSGEGSQMRVALQDVALAMAGNLGFLAEAQINKVDRKRIGNYLYGGFARDFTTNDGRRVMVVVLTRRHWTDLLGATGLGDVVAALETSLGADFTTEDDRFEYREALAGLLQHWFSQRTLDQATTALDGGAYLWSVYRTFVEVVGGAEGDLRDNPMIGEIDQPGVGVHLAPGSPITFGARGTRAEVAPAPRLGEHTEALLHDVLGLGDGVVAGLFADRVVAGRQAHHDLTTDRNAS